MEKLENIKITHVDLSEKQWIEFAVDRYGKNKKRWKFRCPSCGVVHSYTHYNKRSKEIFLTDCECGWKGTGLNPITIHGGIHETHDVFDFWDRPLTEMI